MILHLRSVFSGETDQIPFACALRPADFFATRGEAFASDILVRGAVRGQAGMVTLEAAVSFAWAGACARCGVPVTRDFAFTIRQPLALALNDAESDDFLLVGEAFAPGDFLASEAVLRLPVKILCREDCKGLCVSCGKNQNEGDCGCAREAIDPRWEKLKGVLSAGDS